MICLEHDLLELLRKMFMPTGEKKKGAPGMEFDKVEPDSPNGVYVYDFSKNKWVLKQVDDGPLQPWEDGYYVIYFDNAKCPACRAYDNYWFPFVKLFGATFKNTHYVIVLCDWFARECSSDAASGTFRKFDVHASPTTILIYVMNNEIKSQEVISGVKKIDELLNAITQFISKNTG
ncbi:MAG: hypothetical protein QXS23_04585 [Desulfurococcaceae archaeon]